MKRRKFFKRLGATIPSIAAIPEILKNPEILASPDNGDSNDIQLYGSPEIEETQRPELYSETKGNLILSVNDNHISLECQSISMEYEIEQEILDISTLDSDEWSSYYNLPGRRSETVTFTIYFSKGAYNRVWELWEANLREKWDFRLENKDNTIITAQGFIEELAIGFKNDDNQYFLYDLTLQLDGQSNRSLK